MYLQRRVAIAGKKWKSVQSDEFIVQGKHTSVRVVLDEGRGTAE
jgi:hypothetical protein